MRTRKVTISRESEEWSGQKKTQHPPRMRKGNLTDVLERITELALADARRLEDFEDLVVGDDLCRAHESLCAQDWFDVNG